jgi:hypothetical protein
MPKCPWYLSARAVSECCALFGLGSSEDDSAFARAEDALFRIVEKATHYRDQNNGLQLWRSTIPVGFRKPGSKSEYRIDLLVSTAARTEGNLPQLVTVRLRGHY